MIAMIYEAWTITGGMTYGRLLTITRRLASPIEETLAGSQDRLATKFLCIEKPAERVVRRLIHIKHDETTTITFLTIG